MGNSTILVEIGLLLSFMTIMTVGMFTFIGRTAESYMDELDSTYSVYEVIDVSKVELDDFNERELIRKIKNILN